MADVLYLLTFVAFFALMVAFVYACERVVGKQDVAEAEDAVVPEDLSATTLEEAHA